MRLIDADEVQEILAEKLEEYDLLADDDYCAGVVTGLGVAINTVNTVPLVNPVKRGKWELDKNRGLICCTNCGGERPLKYLDNGTFHKQSFLSPYCPHCGAQMDGESNG